MALVTGDSLMQLKSNAESSHMSLLICINVSSLYKSADYLYKLHNTQCPHYTGLTVHCYVHTKDDFLCLNEMYIGPQVANKIEIPKYMHPDKFLSDLILDNIRHFNKILMKHGELH